MTGDPVLGKRIKWHRDALGRSQQEVADALGVSVKTINNWENGRSMPKVGALEVALKIDLSVPVRQEETDPVLVAINAAAGLSEASKDVLRGTYRNLLRDDARRGEAS